MKTLSGTFAFVALAIIVIVTLPGCCRKQVSGEDASGEEEKFVLKFGKKVGHETEWKWVDVDKTEFDCALRALKENYDENKGQFRVRYKPNAESTPIPGDYDPPPCPTKSVYTDKITTSVVARTEPAEESAGYDPNAVHRVTSNSFKEIKAVLDSFRDPSPTATPSTR